ncbi:Exonuclease_family protein [Hexamita inflata]|uniref:Exonuclease family protein n=1 Tax=Hexamita inflata TaxID=28002 RepID=A0AA86UYP9_9EUKA|nr:Exonuclease family protein [Hexamita inflata]
MGFHGLSQNKGANITKYYIKNQNVAIDGYNILFRFRRQCADVVATGNLDSIAKKIAQFIKGTVYLANMTYLVWDGKGLPTKANKSVPKYLLQQEALNQNAAQFKETKEHSYELLLKAFWLNAPEVQRLNQILENMFPKKLKAFIAPFECDYQLAWMHQQKIIDFVISNDNDLVLFGIPLIRYFDGFNGELLTLSDLSFEGSMQDYIIQQILNGCDYFPYKCGLTYNTSQFSFNGDPGEYGTLNKCVQALITSLMVMRYQMILNLRTKKLEHWQPILDEDDQFTKFMPKNALGFVSKEVVQLSRTDVQINNRAQNQKIIQSVAKVLKMEVKGEKVKLPGIEWVDISCRSIYDEFLSQQSDDVKEKWSYAE